MMPFSKLAFLSSAVFLLAFTIPVLAQQGTTKTVADARTRQALDFVAIQSNNNQIRLMSNKDGKFILIGYKELSTFSFYKMGYRPLTLSLEALLKMDTVLMEEKPFLLNEVTVENKKIDTLVKDKRFYVEDYRVLPNQNFLLITSRINAKGIEVSYYNVDKGILQSKKFPGETSGKFSCDCFKNIHLLTDRFSRQVFFDSDSSFEFLPKYARQLYDSTLRPCALKIDTLLLMEDKLPPQRIRMNYTDAVKSPPYLRYYSVSKHSRSLFYTAGYSARMQEMINHEIEDTRMTQRNEFVGDNQIALFFAKIAGPLYVPVFLRHDSIVLFNFQENKIVFMNRAGKILKLVEMDEAFLTKRAFEVIADEPAQQLYLRMNESERTILRKIDIHTGKLSNAIKLEKIFAKQVQVNNNKIYYLVREKEWDDTQYLYQQN